ncbi:PadR family transcriptional regulator [Sphingoaurantiacus capsulatus]|uniref:PadR family transcriptional regulator n=1 Tax=Sphingoaurantiacus capsulatus TaxID=1771310 RepID=A0ABV7XAM2_9SPHN
MPPRSTRTSLSPDPSELTEHEGSLLALILRQQPVTGYQVVRHYEQSPMGGFNTSKGSIYPAIGRLRDWGFIIAEPIPGGRRGHEQWRCTSDGEAAIRRWVQDLRDSHILQFDPLRTKALSFELLPPDAQLDWVVDTKAQVTARLEAIEADESDGDGAVARLVREHAVAQLRARLQWLDKLLLHAVKNRAG